MADGDPGTPGTPDGADTPDAEPKKKRINWKKVGKIGLPIAVGLAIIAIALGIFLPTKAKDPVARGGVAELKQDNAGLHTDVVDLTKKQDNLASRTSALETTVNDPATGLAAETQKRADEDTRLEGLIDTEATARTDGDTALSASISTEEQARVNGDTTLSTAVEGIAKALHDPANPGAGVVGRLIAVEARVAPPPPVPPPDQVGHRVLNPVR